MDQLTPSLRVQLEENRRSAREELLEALRTRPTERPEPSATNQQNSTERDRVQLGRNRPPMERDRPPTMTDNLPNPSAFASSSNNWLNASNLTAIPSILSLTQNSRIRPDTYDGTTPWSRYQRHFEIAALHNSWSDESKAAQLATCLRGKAQLVLEKLSTDELKNYHKIIEILRLRFNESRLSRMYFNESQARKQKRDEDYKKFAEEIERLVRLAYLNTTRSTLFR